MNKCLLGIISVTMLEANVASEAIYIASSLVWMLITAVLLQRTSKRFLSKLREKKKKSSTIIRYLTLAGKNTPFREHNIISFYSKSVSVHC